MMRRLFGLSSAAVFLLVSASSEATLILYSNKADFLTDTGATSATGPLPNVDAVGADYTVGDVYFTSLSGSLHFGAGTNDWTSLIPGNDFAISGVESFRAELNAGPAFSLGFDIVETTISGGFPDGCHVPTCVDTTFRLTLVLGGVDIPGASFTFNAPNDTLAFVGVWTDFAFDEFRIIDETNDIDDEFWGEFYTGQRPAPEPGALLLLGTGLLIAALGRRRRR
jgi:hypothetical protein